VPIPPIDNEFGMIWFLNLVFSYQEQQKENDVDGLTSCMRFPFKSPFGTQHFDPIKGTSGFPTLRVMEVGVLPTQCGVGHSCGIGIIAAMGIVFRDIIGNDPNGKEHYNEMFCHDRMEVKISTDVEQDGEEHMCSFPTTAFRKLPTQDELGGFHYLHVLKSQ
jgi:hypothetical protein